MRTEVINSENVTDIDWDEAHFKFCDFAGFSIEGEVVSSDFVDCSFKNIDWYWGLFSGSNFIACQFSDCVFAAPTLLTPGLSIASSWTACSRKTTSVVNVTFSTTIAYGCSAERCRGIGYQFSPAIAIPIVHAENEVTQKPEAF